MENLDNSDDLKEFIALRNIIVHNRTVIDDKFLRVVRSDLKVGDKFKLETDYFFNVINIVRSVVKATDKKTTKKFNLKTYILSNEN